MKIRHQPKWKCTGTADWFRPRLETTMADNVIEESDYTPGKDELDWGYEEGRLLPVWGDAERNPDLMLFSRLQTLSERLLFDC